MHTTFLKFLQMGDDQWSARHPLYPHVTIEITRGLDDGYRAVERIERKIEGEPSQFPGRAFTSADSETPEGQAAFCDLAVHARLAECAYGLLIGSDEADLARQILKEKSK